MPKPIIVDIFSGCGGFSLGAELAGFHTELAIDIDPVLQSSFSTNFPKTRTVVGDVAELTKESWKLLTKGLTIDGVIGGPPCQGFSRIGKRDTDDPRRSLVKEFIRTVNILSPSFFVMENVEGILDSQNVDELNGAIKSLNGKYSVIEPITLDASDVGAATKRKRVFVIGFKKNFFPDLSKDDFAVSGRLKSVTVKDAIFDLPKPVNKKSKDNLYGASKYRRMPHSQYAKSMRKNSRILGCRTLKRQVNQSIVTGNFSTKHTNPVLERFANTKMGEIEKVSRYPRLDWNGYCPTLRAGTGSDRGNFQAMRPIHPSENRVITVREAARLQGFPDWFQFHETIHHSFRMIGNSVSPIVSKYIMEKVLKKLNKDQSEEYSNQKI